MLVSNPERFVIIPNIDEGAKFVIAHEAKENISPKETSAITSNGTYNITPSKGYDAMREVEVDVNVPVPTTEEKNVTITSNGEVDVLPTNADAMTKVTANVQVPPPPLEEKQVTITRNGTTEIMPTREYGLSRVKVVAEVAPNLQDKSVTIAKNGTQTIVADEGFEGLNSVEVNSEVYEGFDFSDKGMKDFSDRVNSYFLEDIDKKIISTIDMPANGNLFSLFYDNLDIIALNLSKYQPTIMQALCYACYNLKYAKLNTDNCTNLNSPFRHCYSVEYIELTSIAKNTNTSNIFWTCYMLKECYFTEWKQINISIAEAVLLKPKSIRYIIWHALNGENLLGFENEGATSRTLKLQATPYASWEEWKTTKPSVEDCEYLGVSEEEITKYGELTWEDIALSIKLITIAK